MMVAKCRIRDARASGIGIQIQAMWGYMLTRDQRWWTGFQMSRWIRHLVIAATLTAGLLVSRYAHIVSCDLEGQWWSEWFYPFCVAAIAGSCWFMVGPGCCFFASCVGIGPLLANDIEWPYWNQDTATVFGLGGSLVLLMIASLGAGRDGRRDGSRPGWDMRRWSRARYWHDPAIWEKRGAGRAVEYVLVALAWLVLTIRVPQRLERIREARAESAAQFDRLACGYASVGCISLEEAGSIEAGAVTGSSSSASRTGGGFVYRPEELRNSLSTRRLVEKLPRRHDPESTE